MTSARSAARVRALGVTGRRHVEERAQRLAGAAEHGDAVAEEQRLVDVVGDEHDGASGARARCR